MCPFLWGLAARCARRSLWHQGRASPGGQAGISVLQAPPFRRSLWGGCPLLGVSSGRLLRPPFLLLVLCFDCLALSLIARVLLPETRGTRALLTGFFRKASVRHVLGLALSTCGTCSGVPGGRWPARRLLEAVPGGGLRAGGSATPTACPKASV